MYALPNPGQDAPVSEWLTVDATQAWHWLETCPLPEQRPLRWRHVDMLAAAMVRGEFKPSTIEFYHVGDRVYLVDGQHRLSAITRVGSPVLLNVVRYHVGTYAEVLAAYTRTDRGIGRTYYDCSRAVGLAETLGLTDRQSRELLAAAVPLLAGFEPMNRYPSVRSFDARLAVAQDWAPEAAAIFALYDGAPQSWVRRLTASVPLAVALVTQRYAGGLAQEFWRSVGGMEYLSRGTPEYTLVRYIQDHTCTTGTQPVFARAIAGCWNKRVEGRPLTQVKVSPETIARPILLLGTPYNGKAIVLPFADTAA